MSDVISDWELQQMAAEALGASLRSVCTELLAHRAAERERAKVPQWRADEPAPDDTRRMHYLPELDRIEYRQHTDGATVTRYVDSRMSVIVAGDDPNHIVGVQLHGVSHDTDLREWAKVPMPISRERLEWLALDERVKETVCEQTPSRACDPWRPTNPEVQAIARFALAHMQQPLHSAAAKETEPKGATWLGDCEPPMDKPPRVLWIGVERHIEALLATVKGSSEVDTVRRAALALLGEVGA